MLSEYQVEADCSDDTWRRVRLISAEKDTLLYVEFGYIWFKQNI